MSSSDHGNKEGRRDTAVVGRLERDPNAMRDARQLHTARKDPADVLSRPYILDRYLYDCNNVVDRLMQAPKGHTLHRRTTQTPASLGVDANRAQSKKEERRDAAAVGRLQKDMNAMTDARVLHTARNDQANRDSWPLRLDKTGR